MTSITKNMIAVSALTAAGLVTAVGTIVPRAADLSFSAQVARRFPLSSEMFAPMSAVYVGSRERGSPADVR